jgi:hypothetical protein
MGTSKKSAKTLCRGCIHAQWDESQSYVISCAHPDNAADPVNRYGCCVNAACNNQCPNFENNNSVKVDDLCPGCYYFVTAQDGDICINDITDTDVTTDRRGVIVTCKKYSPV